MACKGKGVVYQMSANETNSKYNIGDWVVHRQHGAGQIKKIQSMEISGNENQYYRIETPASTVWVPVDGQPL